MKKSYLLCSMLLILLFATGYGSPDWPNEPSGATVLLDCPFNDANCGGKLWTPNGPGVMTQPGGTMFSSPNAVASRLAANSSTGGQQTIWPAPGNEKPLGEIYVGFWWKMNANFQGYSNSNNKLFFIATQDFPFGQAQMNGCFLVVGPPDKFPWQMNFSHNSGNLDNSHTCALDLGLTCYPNVGAVPLYPDVWYRVEAYVKASTCTTCRNGIVRWWINGTLVGNYTNMNYGSGVVNEFQINHTWDGQPAASCYNATTNPYGRDCSREWFHYFDHLRISETHGAPAPFYITTSTFPTARTGAPFTATMQATGGTTPYSWLLESGSLPPGLVLNQSTGTITGSPTCAGRSNFSIRVVDAGSPARTASKSYTVVVSGTPACATAIEAIGENRLAGRNHLDIRVHRGKITLNLPVNGHGRHRLSIYTPSGRKIYEIGLMGGNEIRIDRKFANGVYLALFMYGAKLEAKTFSVIN